MAPPASDDGPSGPTGPAGRMIEAGRDPGRHDPGRDDAADVPAELREAVAGSPVARVAVLFARALRNHGVRSSFGDVLLFVRALGEIDVGRRSEVYWAGRATLVRRIEDAGVYDRLFAAFWGRLRSAGTNDEEDVTEIILAFDTGEDEPAAADDDDEAEDVDAPVLSVRWSDREVLRSKDFASCSIEELDELHRLMADLRFSGARRRSRRERPSNRRRGRTDLARTVRRALRSEGETIRRAHVKRGERPRRLVLLCDISGSMEPYSRALVRFVHAAVVGRTKVEAFALATRLTRLTRELSSRDPDAALDRAAAAVEDWSGGTRLGEALRRFNDDWGVRGMARGATVVILSDGWDRGDPEELAEQMARLHRVAYRVVWVNPLKASPGYAPLAQGMAAALPHVDRFIEGHSLESLEALAEVVAT
ncbi:MAG: VWA domain-containing protein [Actinomycetota bacterium]|nr:VWA domain-containing protein [Actinomycetota bacterium]